MKAFLTKMSKVTLDKIIQDCLGNDRRTDDPVKALVEWCKDHGINTADLKSRYPELNTDKGLK